MIRGEDVFVGLRSVGKICNSCRGKCTGSHSSRNKAIAKHEQGPSCREMAQSVVVTVITV